MVKAFISSIHTWHIIQDVSWMGGPRLQYILRGVERLAPQENKVPHHKRDAGNPLISRKGQRYLTERTFLLCRH